MDLKDALPRPNLTHERSNEIIWFIVRNLIATNDTLHRELFPDIAKATAQKIIVRLIKKGLLRRWPLHASKSYLRLGPSAIARWQYPESFARRLGPQVLPYQMGCLSLFSKHKPKLERLLPEELSLRLPGFPDTRDLHQWAYYLEDSSVGIRLVSIRVEYRVGGDAVINKIAEQLHRYRQHPCINQLLDHGRFLVHVVTATAEQEMALWDAAERLSFPVELRTASDRSLTLFL